MAIATQAAAPSMPATPVRDGTAGIRTGGPAFEARTLAMMRGLRSVLGQSAASPGVSAESTSAATGLFAYSSAQRRQVAMCARTAAASAAGSAPNAYTALHRASRAAVPGDRSYGHRLIEDGAQPAQPRADSRLDRTERGCARRAISVRYAAEIEFDRLRCSGGSEASALRTRCASIRANAASSIDLFSGRARAFGLGAHVRPRRTSSARLRVTRAIQAAKFPPRKRLGAFHNLRKTVC